MADERDRLRARLGLPPLSQTSAQSKPTSTVDEQTQRQAMTAAAATPVAETSVVTEPQRYYNYYTGEWVSSPDLIKPRTGMGGPESGGGTIQVEEPKVIQEPAGKRETGREYLGTGKNRILRIYYSDGSSEDFPAPQEVSSSDSEPDASSDALLNFQKAQADAAKTAQRESAFAVLKAEFDKYGLGSLADTVKNLIMSGSPVEEVVLKLRAAPEYEKRFAGNKMRLQAGLNVYDEATYLQLENAYDQIFTSYGITEAAGNTAEARRTRYAGFIGGTISPDEIKGRVQLAVAAANEDVVTRNTLRELYPEITEKDIVSYFLNPKEALPKLETKVRSAQIGAAAVRQGLVTNVATAEELAAMGVTEQQAEQAYSAYAGIKPTLDLLSGLERDNELMVNQQVAEGAFLKNLASEQRKLEMLRQKEIARFSGSAGTNRGALSRETGGLI